MHASRLFDSLTSPLLLLFLAAGAGGCGRELVLEEIDRSKRIGELVLESSSVAVDGGHYTVEEGMLTVSEDPGDSTSRRINLPVRRFRSSNRYPAEPVFWLNGGPGMSNMELEPPTEVLKNHDVVLVGYRGVDGSTVLNSGELYSAVTGSGGTILSAEFRRSFSEAIEQFSRSMRDHGVNFSHYSIAEVISDLELARAGLGYQRINLLSASYGTRVALLYSYRHPTAIHRSVMVGVNPPGRFLWLPSKIDQQLEYYGALEQADSRHPHARSIGQAMRHALKNMPDRWTVFKLDPGKIKIAAFAMLYNKRSAAMVFDSFRAAENGDYSGLYLLQLGYDYMIPKMIVWGDFLAKGLSADFDSSANYDMLLHDSTSVMGSPLSEFIWGTATKHWSWGSLPPDLRRPQLSAVQTLLVSGTVDFSTPAEYATRDLLPYLPNGRQVILREMGHVEDLMRLQPDAFAHLITRYFDEGMVDESGFEYDPVNFTPSVSLPIWAKVLYPFVGLASLF